GCLPAALGSAELRQFERIESAAYRLGRTGLRFTLRLGRLALDREQVLVRNRNRRDVAVGDDDAHAELGDAPHLPGERAREADAAVRCRRVRDHAFVHGDTRPGDPLHEIHRRVVIDIGAVPAILLDDAEHPGRRRMAWHPGRDARMRDGFTVGIEGEPLLVDPDYDPY